MGFRFRRSERVLPKVRCYVSTRGLSLSVGCRRTTANLGARKTQIALGNPGAGLSYSSSSRRGAGARGGPPPSLWRSGFSSGEWARTAPYSSQNAPRPPFYRAACA